MRTYSIVDTLILDKVTTISSMDSTNRLTTLEVRKTRLLTKIQTISLPISTKYTLKVTTTAIVMATTTALLAFVQISGNYNIFGDSTTLLPKLVHFSVDVGLLIYILTELKQRRKNKTLPEN